MANALGTVATDVIAQEALARLVQNLSFIKNVNTNFSQTGLVKGQSVISHIVQDINPALYNNSYTDGVRDAVQTDVEIPLDKHIHTTFQLTDAQRDSSQIELLSRFANTAAQGLGKGIVDQVLSDTNINGITNTFDLQGGGLNMGSIIDMSAEFDAAGVPAGNRWIVAHPKVLANLEKDVTEISNSSYDVSGTILDGGVSRIRGFDVYAYASPYLNETAGNNGAVAGFSESLLLVAAPPSNPPVTAGADLSYVGDPASGLTIQKREWYDPDQGVYNFVLTLYIGTKLSAGDRAWVVQN